MFLPRNRAGAVLLASLAFAPGYATSAAQGWGKVNMHGAIIDTACAIAAGSRDQTIDMDTIPLGQIIRDGQGMTKPFSIELVNCILERPENKPDWKFFQVTFDGYAEGALFGVQGDARGVALEIKDSSGTAVIQETFADGGNNTGKPSAELFHDVDAESPAVEGGSVFFHSAF